MKRHEVKIRDNTFYIRRFDAFTAIAVMGDLQRQFLGPVLSAMEGRPQGADTTEAFISGLRDLSKSTDGTTLRSIAKRLMDPEYVSVSICGAEARKLDDAAVANSIETASELLTLCIESVKWNFADFIERWGSLISSGASLPLAGQSGSSALN